MKCNANVTDDVQCGYIEGNYVKRCDARECMPEFKEYLIGNVEFEKIPIVYYLMMVCLFVLVVISTVLIVFSQQD